MILQIIYKIQYFNPVSGEWVDVGNFPQTQYNEAFKFFHNQYKLNNTKKLRFIQIKDEQLDILFPPDS